MKKLLCFSMIFLMSCGVDDINKFAYKLRNQVQDDAKESLESKSATAKFNLKEQAAADLAGHNVKIALPYFETNATEMNASVKAALIKANNRLDTLASKKGDLTFDNTISELDDIYFELNNVWNRIYLIGSTSNNKQMREASQKLNQELSQWSVETSSRKDIYKVIKSYSDKSQVEAKADAQKLKVETMKSFEKQGFNLSDEKQLELKNLKIELEKLTSEIQKNISESGKKEIFFKIEELKGLSAGQLENLTKVDEKTYKANVGVTYQMYSVLKYASLEKTRKKAFIARNSRAKENASIIESVLKLRSKISSLLGYNSWADYVIEDKMAKTGAAALNFVDDLITKLDKKYIAELEVLRKYKVKQTNNTSAQIHAWDIRYFQKFEEQRLQINMEELKQYFPYEQTLTGMFDLFEELFELNIEIIDAPYKWDELLQLVKISDASSGAPLGYLYLDMHPRPEQDKYGHFAMFTLAQSKILKDGKSSRPVVSLVCNFPEGRNGKPALLTFDHVETLFHEFGHALHSIVSHTTYGSHSGTSVPRDFVEAPSQMLEYFLKDKNVLDRFAKSYITGEKFPADALKKIEALNLATVATFYRRQLAFGKMDLMMHQNAKSQDEGIVDFTNGVLKEVYLDFGEETGFINNFGHLFGGYDAGYYGYAWADSLAADLASKFEQSSLGFLDKEIGMKLREEIYQVGSSQDINKSIVNYLDRAPQSDAFMRKLGLDL